MKTKTKNALVSNLIKTTAGFGVAIAICQGLANAAQIKFTGTVRSVNSDVGKIVQRPIYTFVDKVGVEHFVQNPFTISNMVSVSATGLDGSHLPYDVSPQKLLLNPKGTGRFLVVVGMNGQHNLDFKVCATSHGKKGYVKYGCVAYHTLRVN